MNCRLLSFFLLLIIGFAANAQDKLLLANGKIKDIHGVVVFSDHDEVRYQRAEEQEHERDNLKRLAPDFKGHIWELYKKDAKAKLDQSKFAEEIKKKMETLSEKEFQIWKREQYLSLKEKELAGNFKSDRKFKRVLNRHTKRIKRDLVFSILRADGTEEIVYRPDTLGFLAYEAEPELDYGVNEMRAYIKGRQDGRKHSLKDIGIGAAFGYTIGLLGTAAGQAFYTPLAPAVYIVGMSVSNVKVPKEAMASYSEWEIQAYIDGYERSAKGRKVLGFAVGSVVGLGVGITVGILERPYLN